MANETVVETYHEVSNAFEGIMIKIFGAVIILLIGFVFGKIIGRFVYKGLHELELNKILKKLKINLMMEEALGNVISFVIYLVSVILALNSLGVTSIALYVVLTLIVSFVGISLMLATKDFMPGFYSGFELKKKGIVKGKKIKMGNIEGTVVRVGFVQTKIKTKENDDVYIPNSTLAKENISLED